MADIGNIAALIFAAAIAENIVLAKMLGLCPFAGLSRRLDVAVGVGMATCAVLTLASFVAYWADVLLLVDAPLLRPMVFIAVASAAVAAAELLMRLFAPLISRFGFVFASSPNQLQISAKLRRFVCGASNQIASFGRLSVCRALMYRPRRANGQTFFLAIMVFSFRFV